MNFSSKVALITGAGSERGFGRLTALMLAERGCNIVVGDTDGEGAVKTAELIAAKGVEAFGMMLDVTDPASFREVVNTTLDRFGRIDILVNNAGITQKKTVLEISLEEWNRLLAVDLSGVFIGVKEVLPIMIAHGYGRIVNVSSIAARNGGVYGGPHYCAAKAGVIGFSKAVGKEVAMTGVTVNCVAPGQCNTDIGGNRYENKTAPIGVPMNRRGEAAEVAAAIVFLASEGASYITGCTIDVNGGAYMV